jgi:hypothetical protein
MGGYGLPMTGATLTAGGLAIGQWGLILTAVGTVLVVATTIRFGWRGRRAVSAR